MPSAVYNIVAVLSWPLLRGLYRLDDTGVERIPPEGGFVLAANHISNFDPWPLAMPLWPKRQLYFMAKVELFKPVLGPILRAGGAFPVRRGERDLEAIETRGRDLPARATSSRCSPRGRGGRRGCARSFAAPAALGLGADRVRGGRAARPRGDQGHRPARAPREAAGRLRRARSRSTTSSSSGRATRTRRRPSG